MATLPSVRRMRSPQLSSVIEKRTFISRSRTKTPVLLEAYMYPSASRTLR